MEAAGQVRRGLSEMSEKFNSWIAEQRLVAFLRKMTDYYGTADRIPYDTLVAAFGRRPGADGYYRHAQVTYAHQSLCERFRLIPDNTVFIRHYQRFAAGDLSSKFDHQILQSTFTAPNIRVGVYKAMVWYNDLEAPLVRADLTPFTQDAGQEELYNWLEAGGDLPC